MSLTERKPNNVGVFLAEMGDSNLISFHIVEVGPQCRRDFFSSFESVTMLYNPAIDVFHLQGFIRTMLHESALSSAAVAEPVVLVM